MKKSFKVRLVFGHSKTPMEVRKTFKNVLNVPIMFTLKTVWCYSGQRKISNFRSQKNWISFFPHAEFVLFYFQSRLSGKRGVRNNRYCWNTKETAQNFCPTLKKLREKKEICLWFLTRKWKVGLWWIKRCCSAIVQRLEQGSPVCDSCPLQRTVVIPKLFCLRCS